MGWWEYPFDEEDGDEDEIDHPVPLMFEITTPELECLGILYAPDGEILIELWEDRMPFGFNLE